MLTQRHPSNSNGDPFCSKVWLWSGMYFVYCSHWLTTHTIILHFAGMAPPRVPIDLPGAELFGRYGIADLGLQEAYLRHPGWIQMGWYGMIITASRARVFLVIIVISFSITSNFPYKVGGLKATTKCFFWWVILDFNWVACCMNPNLGRRSYHHCYFDMLLVSIWTETDQVIIV